MYIRLDLFVNMPGIRPCVLLNGVRSDYKLAGILIPRRR